MTGAARGVYRALSYEFVKTMAGLMRINSYDSQDYVRNTNLPRAHTGHVSEL